MTKYNQAFKQQVVAFYFECHENLSQTLKHFSLLSKTVRQWIAKFNHSGNNGLAVLQTKRYYTSEFKYHVIQTLFNVQLTLEQAVLQFGVSNSGIVSQWLKTFQEQGITGLQPKPKGRPSMKPKYAKIPPPSKTKEDCLRLRILELEAENAYLKKLDEIVKRDETRKRKLSKD